MHFFLSARLLFDVDGVKLNMHIWKLFPHLISKRFVNVSVGLRLHVECQSWSVGTA